MSTDSIALGWSVADPGRPAGFEAPDFSSPLDEAETLARIPEEATVKGMFLASAVAEIRAQGHEPPTIGAFLPFDDYSMRHAVELLFAAARVVYPAVPIREGIRRLTRPAYATFAGTLIGKVLFATVGRSPAAVYRLAARAWPHGASHGRLASDVLDDRTAVVVASEFPLPEAAAVGIAEGVLRGCRREGTVAVRHEGRDALRLWIRWR